MNDNPPAWAIEAGELAAAASQVLAENAAEFAQSITDGAVETLRRWRADDDAIAAALARADSVVGEGWEWAYERYPLWRDVLGWVAGEREACPLPAWAVVP